MSTVQRIARNTTVLLVAQVATYLLAFFYMMYAARYLGAAGFGILSFAIAFTAIFGVLTDLGLSPLAVREVARDKSMVPKYLANVGLLKVILVAVTFGLIALTINLMGYPQETVTVVYLFGLYVVLGAFTQMFYSIFQAFERMEFQAIGQMLNAALLLGGVIFAIKHGYRVVGFASLYVIANGVALGYGFAVMKLRFSSSASASVAKLVEFDWNFWKSMVRKALPFFVAGALDLIALRIAMVILSAMKGDEAVGWYSSSFQIMQVFLFIPAAFLAALYPVLSRFYVSSQESLRFAYEKSFKYLSVLGLPIAVGGTIFADRIILGIFHEGFAPSIIALRVLIWAVPLGFLTQMFGTILASINRQDLAAKIVLAYTVLNVVMNLILIPRYGYVGASMVMVITSLTAFVPCFYLLSKLVCKISIPKLIFRPVIASGLMALFLFFSTRLSLWLLIPLAAIIYFGILILLRTFSREDLNLFKEIATVKPGTRGGTSPT
jgi:O-antigen/teichoic acid export membrane protein